MKNSTATSKTAQFTTATLGPVSHPSNLLMEFLEVWQKRDKVKACILSWFDSWHKSKGETGWICASYQQIAKAFGYCRDTIWRHLTDLIQEGYVRCRHLRKEEKSYPTDTRKMYQINFVKLRQKVGQENQESSCLKSDGYPSEVQTLEAESQTDLNSFSNLSKTSLTHQAALESCVCEEGLKIFSEQEQIQKTEECSNHEALSHNNAESNTEEFSQHSELKTQGETNSVDQPKGSEEDQGSAQLLTKLNELIHFPLLPIRFNAVKWVIDKYRENLVGAVAAVEQGLIEGWITNPTGYLIKALQEGISVEAESSHSMGRNQWWKWIAQEWGHDKRNCLIERISDLGEGLKVYFSNGLEYPFEEVKLMSLAEVEVLATSQDESPQDHISPEQVQYFRAMIRGIGG